MQTLKEPCMSVCWAWYAVGSSQPHPPRALTCYPGQQGKCPFSWQPPCQHLGLPAALQGGSRAQYIWVYTLVYVACYCTGFGGCRQCPFTISTCADHVTHHCHAAVVLWLCGAALGNP